MPAMHEMTIGLVSHLVGDYNLGCSALAISNIHLMDAIFEEHGVRPHYRAILPEPRQKINLKAYTTLEGFTSNNYSYRTYPRLKATLKRPSLIYRSNAFEGCDLVVDLCGGDGYTDNYGMVRLLAESLAIEGARAHAVPVYFAPQTIGPFNTKAGKMVAKRELGRLSGLFVRDGRSYECCFSLGLKVPVRQVIDVAFALPYEKRSLHHNGKINVGLNVSGLLYSGGYNHKNYFNLSFSYRDFIRRVVERLVGNDDVLVHLVPHVVAEDGGEGGVDDDYSVCRELRQQYPSLILPDPFSSASEAKSYISSMDFFSGARMHSTIGAMSSGVPVVPVAYSRKFNGLYDSLGYRYLIDAKAHLSCDDAVDMFFDYFACRDELAVGVEQARPVWQAALERYKQEFAEMVGLL